MSELMDLASVSKIQISSDVISQEVFFEETILLNVTTLTYFGLDALGTYLWKLLGEGVDPATIVEKLTLRFDLPLDAARSKCTGILVALQKTGLITVDS